MLTAKRMTIKAAVIVRNSMKLLRRRNRYNYSVIGNL
jgi:hypothetical protein